MTVKMKKAYELQDSRPWFRRFFRKTEVGDKIVKDRKARRSLGMTSSVSYAYQLFRCQCGKKARFKELIQILPFKKQKLLKRILYCPKCGEVEDVSNMVLKEMHKGLLGMCSAFVGKNLKNFRLEFYEELMDV